MVESQTTQDKKEKIVFSKQIAIQLVEKEYYSQYAGTWFKDRYAIIGGETIILNDRSFEDILKSIKRKIDVLSDLRRDESYEALKKEILSDIAHLMYKLEQGEHA